MIANAHLEGSFTTTDQRRSTTMTDDTSLIESRAAGEPYIAEVDESTRTVLRARIALQVNDGVFNILHEGKLPVYDTKPADHDKPGVSPDAKAEHTVNAADVITLVASTLRAEIETWRDRYGASDSLEKYLTELQAWIFAPTKTEETAA